MSMAAPETYASSRALVRLVLQSALPRPQKVVLLALLAYARADLTVYHAQGQLAWECDYTRPVIRKALAALEAQAILRVLQGPRQHRATEYAIDLSHMPSRAPYYAQDSDAAGPTERAASPKQREIQLPAEAARLTSQRAIKLPAENAILPAQHETEFPADGSEGHSVALNGQITCPPVVQEEQEKTFLLRSNTGKPLPLDTSGHHPLPFHQQRQSAAKRLRETPAPETLPLTDDLRRWATDTVLGLSLDRERDKFLCYARAHGLTNVDWSEALKFWWLEAHARAVRRGELQLQIALRPAPAPEPPPLYDAELHAQIQADIACLCDSAVRSTPGADDHEEPRRRRAPSILTAEGMALEQDPAYLAQMRARRAMLQAQAALLRAQEPCLDAAGAAD